MTLIDLFRNTAPMENLHIGSIFTSSYPNVYTPALHSDPPSTFLIGTGFKRNLLLKTTQSYITITLLILNSCCIADSNDAINNLSSEKYNQQSIAASTEVTIAPSNEQLNQTKALFENNDYQHLKYNCNAVKKDLGIPENTNDNND